MLLRAGEEDAEEGGNRTRGEEEDGGGGGGVERGKGIRKRRGKAKTFIETKKILWKKGKSRSWNKSEVHSKTLRKLQRPKMPKTIKTRSKMADGERVSSFLLPPADFSRAGVIPGVGRKGKGRGRECGQEGRQESEGDNRKPETWVEEGRSFDGY